MVLTSTAGLIAFRRSATTSTFNRLFSASDGKKRIERDRLPISTTSKSTTTMCPTPSSTRFFSTSLPKAPHPTTITWAAETRCCSKHFIILSILASLSSSRPPCRFLSVRPSLPRSYIHHLPGESGMVWNQADSPTHTGSYPLSHR